MVIEKNLPGRVGWKEFFGGKKRACLSCDQPRIDPDR